MQTHVLLAGWLAAFALSACEPPVVVGPVVAEIQPLGQGRLAITRCNIEIEPKAHAARESGCMRSVINVDAK